MQGCNCACASVLSDKNHSFSLGQNLPNTLNIFIRINLKWFKGGRQSPSTDPFENTSAQAESPHRDGGKSPPSSTGCSFISIGRDFWVESKQDATQDKSPALGDTGLVSTAVQSEGVQPSVPSCQGQTSGSGWGRTDPAKHLSQHFSLSMSGTAPWPAKHLHLGRRED